MSISKLNNNIKYINFNIANVSEVKYYVLVHFGSLSILGQVTSRILVASPSVQEENVSLKFSANWSPDDHPLYGWFFRF